MQLEACRSKPGYTRGSGRHCSRCCGSLAAARSRGLAPPLSSHPAARTTPTSPWLGRPSPVFFAGFVRVFVAR
eukprot:2209386-Pyramimonas_sp.AAC.1